jgi:hypothetical protein
MTTQFFDGDLDLNALQDQMNFYEGGNFVAFGSLSHLDDATATTSSGSHHFNQGTYAPLGSVQPKDLALVQVAAGQDFGTARTAGEAKGLTFAFNCPQVYVSDAQQDVIAFRSA